MTYQNFSFTAFSGSDLFGDGKADRGDHFEMPQSATTCFTVRDGDGSLSGDSYDHAIDKYGQTATIEGPDGHKGNGGQIYAESYHWVSDQHGNWYVLIEIEQEGSHEDYYTFYTPYGVPAAGAKLTLGSECDVSGDWLKYNCLDAGEKAPDFVECDDPNAVKIDFEGLSRGTLVSDQYAGVTIRGAENDSSDSATDNDAMVFDSANPTGGDSDLATSSQGNVLILTENDRADNPDDSAKGGTLTFDFDAPAQIFDIKVIDTEEGGTIKLFDADGALIKTVEIPRIGDGAIAQVMIEAEGVSSMELTLNGSGAIDDLCYVPAQTGTISGTVFCDTDCDGISEETVTVPGHDYTIEAEDMYACGFKTVHGDKASGGELVKLQTTGYSGWDGYLQSHFQGKTGTYDLKLHIQDENDGQSKIWVKIGGHLVQAFRLDRDSDGGGGNDGHFSTFVIPDVDVSHGEEILIVADGAHAEYVRIDKIVFEGEDTTTTESEPVKEGVLIKLLDADGNVVAETTTDADGNYAFENVPRAITASWAWPPTAPSSPSRTWTATPRTISTATWTRTAYRTRLAWHRDRISTWISACASCPIRAGSRARSSATPIATGSAKRPSPFPATTTRSRPRTCMPAASRPCMATRPRAASW